MLAAASRREFDVVLFWALDRFSREGVYVTLQHLQSLTSYGVGYRSFTEQYLDSCGLFKDAVISILATIAKQERIRLSERTIAGLERAKANGRVAGRPRVICNRDKVLALRQSGQSLGMIASKLGLTKTTVHRIVNQLAPTPAQSGFWGTMKKPVSRPTRKKTEKLAAEKPIALTVKIDNKTYIRLSTVRAKERKTAQEILTEALYAYLDQAGA